MSGWTILSGAPHTLRLAGVRYDVNYVDGSSQPLDTQYTGQINHAKQRIVVDASQTADMARKTLLHEIVHGVDKLFVGSRLTEEQVVALEHGLWAVFRDNPGLSKFIFED